MAMRNATVLSRLLAGHVRSFGTSAAVAQERRIPPWVDEKLRNEGYTREQIEEGSWFEKMQPNHGINVDTAIKMTKNYYVTWDMIKNYRKNKKKQVVKEDQKFLSDRRRVLGPEIATATFVVHRGGAVKFHEKDSWIQRDREADVEYDLPKKYERDWTLEAIDLRGFHLISSGVENLAGCEDVRSIAARNQPFLNDWCLDAFTAMFQHSLEFLDLSGCPQVTERGLAVLHRCRKLRKLYLVNMPHLQNAELLAMRLEDALPDCQVSGIDYWKEAAAATAPNGPRSSADAASDAAPVS